MAKAAEAAEAGATVCCLVPSRTCTAWFHDQVLARGAEVRHIRGRLRFGTATNSAPFASLVVIYRPAAVRPVSAEPVTVRPEAHVENILQPSERHQVRPRAARQQVLHRGAGETGRPAGADEAAPIKGGAKRGGHRLGVPGGGRRPGAQRAVQEGPGDIVRRLPS